jgi:ABC-type multidrug transport system ATPase subunit
LVGRYRTTILFASHNLAEVEQLSDLVVLLDRGRIVACDSPRVLRVMTGATTLEQALETLTIRNDRAEISR